MCDTYECLNDSHCEEPTPLCDNRAWLYKRECVECLSGTDCFEKYGLPYDCMNGECKFSCDTDVECNIKNPLTPICKSAICVECKTDFDCTSNPLYGDAHKCNVTDNSCYFYCGSTDDCPVDHPYCNLGECWQCLSNPNCEDNPDFGEGYACDGITHECIPID